MRGQLGGGAHGEDEWGVRVEQLQNSSGKIKKLWGCGVVMEAQRCKCT